MVGVDANTSIKEYQDFVKHTYKKPNDMHFDLNDMLSNVQRFAMRGLKGIRNGNKEKSRLNFIISLSWFMSTMNRLHIDIEDAMWKRFPYLCSYCASCPCSCSDNKWETRKDVSIDDAKRPGNMKDFQVMFDKVYPSSNRDIYKAGVHMAEEVGELSEAILAYRGSHKEDDFDKVILESADLLSHYFCVFNSLDMDIAHEISNVFDDNCHICNKMPCNCDFDSVIKFRS